MRAKCLFPKAVWFGGGFPSLLLLAIFQGWLPRAATQATPSTRTPIQDSSLARKARERMVEEQIAKRGVRDRRVLEALRKVPRHLFVPPEMQPHAYLDTPLAIGHGQTISQPYIVGFMSEALELRPQERVLEIGTGSGYQAAVLALLAREVYSMEIVEPLGKSASERLQRLGYENVQVRIGDGYQGWPEAAPFDAIIVTAAPGHIPQPLLDQLAPGGRLVIPVGKNVQMLVRVRRTAMGFQQEKLLPVLFVPMTGEAEN
ncbi:MAG TPA: protein-L-isoaspartate(D-aspartate) O-methyltransferase [Terriglobia bacterium]|nr:protein-L-isoaspartate(D-aspartate) O-methyltransferase [Terriglobia bacterium]